MSKIEELKNAILKELLTDFKSQNLALDDLSNCYVGPNLAALKEKCCGGAASASSVDFDVALKDLEDGDLVDTGPMDASRIPGVFAVSNKREYAFLTEKGYKAAKVFS